jgi:hypothetical protein
MEELLTSFTTDASGTSRDVSSDVPMPSDTWVTPSMTGVLAEALLLHPVMHYVRARRTGLLRYATNRDIYKRCLASTDFSSFDFLEPTSTTSRFGV